MATFKYMKMQAEYNLEQTKKGANGNIQWPQMAALAGMQAGMQNGQFGGANFMAPPGAMGMAGAGFQMPNMGGMPGLSPAMMNPAMFAPQSPQGAGQFNGMAG